MNIKLAENIRTFRKERSLTQEQLAEALGVTVGAVYKWEAKLSLPELNLIMEMADFFDTSVDVLLGYEMKDNRLSTTIQRLKDCRSRKDRTGLSDAEKALKKYPNSFDVVYNSARLYFVFGVEARDKALLRRALELTERVRLLLPQNTDPKINESTICAEMATILLSLGDAEQAVALLKTHNSGGIYNDLIGLTLAGDCNRPAEAIPFLDEALLNTVSSLIRIITGYLNVFFERHDFSSAQAILKWGLDTFAGLTDGEHSNFLWKISSVFYTCLAHAQIERGDIEAARKSLIRAWELAMQFDASPDYSANAVRFVTEADQAGIYDDLGATATESVEKTIEQIGNERLSALWEELNEHEE